MAIRKTAKQKKMAEASSVAINEVNDLKISKEKENNTTEKKTPIKRTAKSTTIKKATAKKTNGKEQEKKTISEQSTELAESSKETAKKEVKADKAQEVRSKVDKAKEKTESNPASDTSVDTSMVNDVARRGRPIVDKDGEKADKRITLYVTSKEVETIETLAGFQKKSVNQFIRDALKDKFDTEDVKKILSTLENLKSLKM